MNFWWDVYAKSGAHEKTTGKERATPTQLIKIAKARHLVGLPAKYTASYIKLLPFLITESQILALTGSRWCSTINCLNTHLFFDKEWIHRPVQKYCKGIFYTTRILLCFISMPQNSYSIPPHAHHLIVMMPHPRAWCHHSDDIFHVAIGDMLRTCIALISQVPVFDLLST